MIAQARQEAGTEVRTAIAEGRVVTGCRHDAVHDEYAHPEGSADHADHFRH